MLREMYSILYLLLKIYNIIKKSSTSIQVEGFCIDLLVVYLVQ